MDSVGVITFGRSATVGPMPRAKVGGTNPVTSSIPVPFPVDPTLPHLETAGNPVLMREVFQEHLKPVDGKSYEVVSCQISHTRYRMAIRCLLLYTLRIADTTTGQESSLWVTGTMYTKGRTLKAWRELQQSRGDEPILSGSTAPFVPFSYAPEIDMLLQVFPYDRRLPTLSLVMAKPPELATLLLSRFGAGDWQSEHFNVEPIRYVSESRAVLRLTMRARNLPIGRVEEKRFYAKVYLTEETGAQTYEALRTLWEVAHAGGRGFGVGRPVAYLCDLRTLIQEETSGIQFAELLLRDNEVVPATRKVADALAALHTDNLIAPRRHSLEDERIRLARMRRHFERAYPHLETMIEETFRSVLAGLKKTPLAPTHGDLKPEHILFDEERLSLTDLDDFAEADPITDVARMLAYIAVVPDHLSPSEERRREIGQIFVDKYFAHVPGAWRARLPVRYAAAIIRVAHGVLRNQPPGWSDRVEAMLDEARISLKTDAW